LITLQVAVVPGTAQQARYMQAYNDIRQFLFLFENGVPRQLEQQPVRSFKAGGERLAYVNNANDLIVYEGGEKHKLGDMTATTYELNQACVYYRRDQLLSVFQNGENIPLTFFIRDYKVSDSLIAFRDRNADILRVFHNGNIRELELTLTGTLNEYKTGENTVAYVNNTGFFKSYWHDQLWDIDNVAPESFEPGGDIVGYVDGFYSYFKVFYNGKILVLEKLVPQSYQVGVETVAYVADNNAFKVFNRGKLLKIEDYIPEFYRVRDRSVLFFLNNRLQLISDGVRYELDEFMPSSYRMNDDNIAWQDINGRLHVFTEGKSYQVSQEAITAYELNGNVLKYDLRDGTSRIWYKGKVYGSR
jgi:hypothetical protein